MVKLGEDDGYGVSNTDTEFTESKHSKACTASVAGLKKEQKPRAGGSGSRISISPYVKRNASSANIGRMKRKRDSHKESSSGTATAAEDSIPMTTVVNLSDSSQSDDNSDSSSGFNDSETKFSIIFVEKPHFRIELTRNTLIENLEQIRNLVQKIAGRKVEINTNSPMNYFGRKKKKSKHRRKGRRNCDQKISESNDSHLATETELKKEREDENLSEENIATGQEVSISSPPNSSVSRDSIQFSTDQPSRTITSPLNVQIPPNKDVQNMNSSLETYREMNNGDLEWYEREMGLIPPSLGDTRTAMESNEGRPTSGVQSTAGQLKQTLDIEQQIKWEPELNISDDDEPMNTASNHLLEATPVETIKPEPVENPEPVNVGAGYVLTNTDIALETPSIIPKHEVKDEPVEEEKQKKVVEVVTVSDTDDDDDKELDVNCKIGIESEEVNDNRVEIAVSTAFSKNSLVSDRNDNIQNGELTRRKKRKKIHGGDKIQKKKRFTYSEEKASDSTVANRSQKPSLSSDGNKDGQENAISEQGNGRKRNLSEGDEILDKIDRAIGEGSYNRKYDNATTRRTQERCSTDIGHQQDKSIIGDRNKNHHEETIPGNKNVSHKKGNVAKTLRNEKPFLDQERLKNENRSKRFKEERQNRVDKIVSEAPNKYKPKNQANDIPNRRHSSDPNPNRSPVNSTNTSRNETSRRVEHRPSMPNESSREHLTNLSKPINNPHSHEVTVSVKDTHVKNIDRFYDRTKPSSPSRNCTKTRQSNEREDPSKKNPRTSASESTKKANNCLLLESEKGNLLNKEKPQVKVAQSASFCEKTLLKDIGKITGMNTIKLPELKSTVDVIGANRKLQVEAGDGIRVQDREDLAAKRSEEMCLIDEHYKKQENKGEHVDGKKGRGKSPEQVNETLLNREMSLIHYSSLSEGQTTTSQTPFVDGAKSSNENKVSVNSNHIIRAKAQIHSSSDPTEKTILQSGISGGVENPSKSILSEPNLRCSTKKNSMVSRSDIENSKTSTANSEEKSHKGNPLSAKENRSSNVRSQIRKSLDAAKETPPKVGICADSGNLVKTMHLQTNLPCDISTPKGTTENDKTSIRDTGKNSNDETAALPNRHHVSEIKAGPRKCLGVTKKTRSKPGTSREGVGSGHPTTTGGHYDVERKPMASFLGRIPKMSGIQPIGTKSSRSPNDYERRSSDSGNIYPGRSPLINPDQNGEICETGKTIVEGNRKQHPGQLPRLFPATNNNAKGENNYRNWSLFLNRILNWNPIWLQKKNSRNVPQLIARKEKLALMRLTYETYEEYYSDAEDLLALNIWYNMTSMKEMNAMTEKGPTKFSISGHSTLNETVAGIEVKQTKLFLHVLVGKGENARHTLPSVGDLVFFDYFPEQERRIVENKDSTESQLFAYVEKIRSKNLVRDKPRFNDELLKSVRDPHDLLTYEVITKPIESRIVRGRISEMQTLPYFNKNIRSIQALHHLRISPLLSMVLHPKAKDYQLPPVSDLRKFSSSTNDYLDEKQKEAVATITDTVFEGKPKICLINGPPGSGKTKVIVSLLNQLHHERQCNKARSFRILVCAQTNSAVDEIVMSILESRRTHTDPKERFKMVRTGRTDMMQEDVKKVSLPSLANKEVQRYIASGKTSYPEKADRALTFQKNEITKLKEHLEKNGTMITPDMKKRILRKISDHETKYHVSAKLHKNETLEPKEKEALRKTMENTILEGAHVIASTLTGCCAWYMESMFDGESDPITVCIVDNATHGFEAETLLPLLLGVKILVLVGGSDPEPRSLMGRNKEVVGTNQSLFTRLQQVLSIQTPNPIIQLSRQYRMSYEVSRWPERYFYGGPFHNVTNLPTLPLHSYKVFHLDSIEDNDVKSLLTNKFEGLFVTTIAYALLNCPELTRFRVPLRIGVLTLSRPQKEFIEDRIKDRLGARLKDSRNNIIIDVNTIDTFQGQERDVVIMSCVKTCDIGRLADRQTVCLAMTRAKQSMILCGNFDAYETDPMWNDLLSDAKSRGVYSNLKWNIDVSKLKGHIMR